MVRRKMDAMKEERRRQEILMKRREQIREATERYQRLKKNYVPGNAGLYPVDNLSLRFRSVIIVSFNVSQGVWSAYGILCDFSQHCSCYMQCLGHEWDYPIHALNIACAVLKADAVATGEVSCYNCIV